MSSWNRTAKSPKFVTHRSLTKIGESTLSHPLSYLVKYAVDCPERSLGGYSPRYAIGNSKGSLDGYSASYRAGYLPENPVSSGEDCQDSNSAGPPADYPEDSQPGLRRRKPAPHGSWRNASGKVKRLSGRQGSRP